MREHCFPKTSDTEKREKLGFHWAHESTKVLDISQSCTKHKCITYVHRYIPRNRLSFSLLFSFDLLARWRLMITRSFVWRLLLYGRARFSNSFVSSAAPGKQKKYVPKAQKQRDITQNHTQQIPTEVLRPQIYYHPISTKKETRRRRKHTRQNKQEQTRNLSSQLWISTKKVAAAATSAINLDWYLQRSDLQNHAWRHRDLSQISSEICLSLSISLVSFFFFFVFFSLLWSLPLQRSRKNRRRIYFRGRDSNLCCHFCGFLT